MQSRQGVARAQHRRPAWRGGAGAAARPCRRADPESRAGCCRAAGLAATQVVARHPRLVAVDISGYGEGGPLSHKRAYDLLVQSEGGSCAVTGGPGQPAKPGIAMIDLATGMYALSWILGALHARHATGRGEAITVGMFDVVAEWMGYQVNYTMGTGLEQEPAWVGSPAVAPYGTYPTSDGQTVVLGTTNDGEWQRLARTVLERPDLAEDPALASNAGRVAERARVDEAIAAWTGAVTLKEAQDVLDAAALGNARLNGVQDVIDHPQLAVRDRWREVPTPQGSFRAVLPPPVAASWTSPMGRVPGLGEHTEGVLAELGYSTADLADWRRDGVIAS
nr:CaiB/BaiF CoA-transferase family protein [Pseudofrankia sp. BMG5.36]